MPVCIGTFPIELRTVYKTPSFDSSLAYLPPPPKSLYLRGCGCLCPHMGVFSKAGNVRTLLATHTFFICRISPPRSLSNLSTAEVPSARCCGQATQRFPVLRASRSGKAACLPALPRSPRSAGGLAPVSVSVCGCTEAGALAGFLPQHRAGSAGNVTARAAAGNARRQQPPPPPPVIGRFCSSFPC